MTGTYGSYLSREVGQLVQGPTLVEAKAAARKALAAVTAEHERYLLCSAWETAAFHAQVLANLAGDFAQAAYTLQRAAYLKATE